MQPTRSKHENNIAHTLIVVRAQTAGMGKLTDRIKTEQLKNLTGSYSRFDDIEGIGPKTANKLGGFDYQVNRPSDVADFSADELADQANISKTRAAKAIKGGGGNPRISKQSTQGSVSAAGMRMPVGHFMVDATEHGKAEGKFASSMDAGIGRSQEAAQADKGKRAPITTDIEEWQANKSALDYPGVDTPSESPDAMDKDKPFLAPNDLVKRKRDDLFDL